MTEEQERLCALIEGHCEAMKAQVVDPKVKLEFLTAGGGKWTPVETNSEQELFSDVVIYQKCWRRLAPAPRLVPLDQSDFLGEGRVTHLRLEGVIMQPVQMQQGYVLCGLYSKYSFAELTTVRMECSRDNGATWSKCEKPAP